MPIVGTGNVLERLEFPGRHLISREFQTLCTRLPNWKIGNLMWFRLKREGRDKERGEAY